MSTGETGETCWSKAKNQQQTQPKYGVNAAGFEPDIAGRRVLSHYCATGPAPLNPLVNYQESYKHTLFAFYA